MSSPSLRRLAEQATDMKQVDDLRRERATLAAAEREGRNLFGTLWEGEASDWDYGNPDWSSNTGYESPRVPDPHER